MKLAFLFIMMDLLTLLAYPLVYAYGKMYLVAKVKERIHVL